MGAQRCNRQRVRGKDLYHEFLKPSLLLTLQQVNVVNSAALRSFVLPSAAAGGSFGALVNGSRKGKECMWLTDDSSQAAWSKPWSNRGGVISMAPCGTPGTAWTFSATSGQIESADNAGMCVGYWSGPMWPLASLRQMVAPVACSGANGSSWATKFKSVNAANGVAMMQAVLAGNSSRMDPHSDLPASSPAQAPLPPCLSIVRDNINISLAMAVSLSASSDGKPIAPIAPRPYNPFSWHSCGPNQGAAACKDVHTVSATYELQAGKEYLLRIGIATTRSGGDDTNPRNEPAMGRAQALASGAVAAAELEAANQRVWAGKIDICGGQYHVSLPQ